MTSALRLWFFRDLSDDQRLKLFSLFDLPTEDIGKNHGKQDAALQFIMKAMIKMVAEATAPTPEKHLMGKAEAFDKIVAARKKHVDAVAAYNARRELATAERMRGNWAIKLDDEYRAMNEAQSELFVVMQTVCDAALATTEGKDNG